MRVSVCACVRACVFVGVCVSARVHLGSAIGAAATRCVMEQLCGTECMSWKGCCLYFSRAPGVNLDEGVKQVLSVGASQPIGVEEIRVQGFRGVSTLKVSFLP